MTHRLSPPSSGFYNPITLNGVTYQCAAGSTLDVPDHIADILEANGWSKAAAGGAGATAARPASPKMKHTFLDTTLGYVVQWNGKAWVNPATGASV